MSFLGPLISAGASLLGGLFGRDAQKDQNAQIAMNNAIAQQNAERNIQLQKDFAQQGIRWKVQDAKAAGIHPLYALGAGTTSFSPVSVGLSAPVAETGMASGLAAAGQDVSRAINATRTAPERMQAFSDTAIALDLRNKELQGDLLSAQIAKLRSSINPPMPVVSSSGPVPLADKPEDRPQLFAGNGPIDTDPKISNAEDYEKRYGELSDWTVGPYIAYRDMLHNSGGFWSAMRDASRKVLPWSWYRGQGRGDTYW